eukprot:4171082-Pyramimonas_sp.AAC.1
MPRRVPIAPRFSSAQMVGCLKMTTQTGPGSFRQRNAKNMTPWRTFQSLAEERQTRALLKPN